MMKALLAAVILMFALAPASAIWPGLKCISVIEDDADSIPRHVLKCCPDGQIIVSVSGSTLTCA